MADSTVNIVHELTFVTNEASVAKVDETIGNITRTLTALNHNTKQVGANLNSIVAGLNKAGKEANDYANSMKRASEATAKFGQASANTGNLSNAAAAKMTAGFAKATAQFQQLQQTMMIALTASNRRIQGLNDETRAAQAAAAQVGKLAQAYTQVRGSQPRTTTSTSSGGSSGGSSGVDDGDMGRILGVKLSAIQRRFVTGYIVGAGFTAFNATLDAIKSFFAESSQFASQMDGIAKAFERIADPGLITRLRAATGGTVSDLDLMQRSVNAVNLGLPIEGLAKAFEFARVRARETGQSVDYLVNSIVLGIGRKSPLILDNLGINALRVRERFKEIGDFGKAAFEIINEEIEKSGTYVDQYADRVDRLTASIQNQQAEFGKLVNASKDYSRSFLLDVVDIFKNANLVTLGTPTNTLLLREARKAAEEDAEITRKAQIEADKRYLDFFGKFQDDLVDADFLTRNKIIKQAEGFYDQLRTLSGQAYNTMGVDADVWVRAVDMMKQKLDRLINGQKQRLSNLKIEDIKLGTKEELEEILKLVELERTPLTSGDSVQIARDAAIQKEAQRNLDIINAKERRKRRVAQPEVGLELDLAKRIAAVQEKINEARAKDEAETSTKIEAAADSRIAKYNEELDAIVKAAQKRGALSVEAQRMVSQLRIMVRDLNAIMAGNDQRDLFDKRLLDLHKAYEERVQAAKGLRGTRVAEGDVSSVSKIRKQIDLELQAELNGENDRHKAAMKAYRENNEATEHEETAHFLRMEDIQLKYQHRQIAAMQEHFDQVRKEMQRQFALEAAAMDAIAAGEQSDLTETEGGFFFDREHRQRLIGARRRKREAAAASTQAGEEYRTAQTQTSLTRGAVDADGNLLATTPAGKRAVEDAYAAEQKAYTKKTEAAEEARDADHDYNEAILENIPKIIDLYNEMASQVAQAYSAITEAQRQQLATEIQIRETRLQQAEKFAERGNTTYLRQEQERLDRAYQQQAKAARQQIAINTALTASQAALGVVKAAVQGTEGGPYLIIANVIAFLGAIAAGVVAASNTANSSTPSTQFAEGGYTGDGGKYQAAGTVHKGEFVANQETTKRHRKVLESMHDGSFDDKYAHVDDSRLRLSDTTGKQDKATLKKLDEVVDAIDNSSVSVKQSLNERGLLQVVERISKQDRNRFR